MSGLMDSREEFVGSHWWYLGLTRRCNINKCGKKKKKKKTEVGKSQKDGLQSTYSTNHKPCGAPREVLEFQQEACAFEELLLWLGSSEVWGCPGLKVPIQRPARFLLPS